MNKDEAEKLARFLGLEAEQTGGNVYAVTMTLPNGMKIIFGEESYAIETLEDTLVPFEILAEWEG
jgi:hypothetical protein